MVFDTDDALLSSFSHNVVGIVHNCAALTLGVHLQLTHRSSAATTASLNIPPGLNEAVENVYVTAVIVGKSCRGGNVKSC